MEGTDVAGELSLGDDPAHTAPLLGPVLGGHDDRYRDLSDLADFDVTINRGIGQIGTATVAAHRRMGLDCVGVGHLGQVVALGAGLLAGLSPERAPSRPVGALGLALGEEVRRRRERRVGRVLREALLELGDLALELADQVFELAELCDPRCIEPPQDLELSPQGPVLLSECFFTAVRHTANLTNYAGVSRIPGQQRRVGGTPGWPKMVRARLLASPVDVAPGSWHSNR